MEHVLSLLEDHDLAQAEARMRFLIKQTHIETLLEQNRQLKLLDLRKRLEICIRLTQRNAPFTAIIRFRQALKAWAKVEKG